MHELDIGVVVVARALQNVTYFRLCLIYRTLPVIQLKRSLELVPAVIRNFPCI